MAETTQTQKKRIWTHLQSGRFPAAKQLCEEFCRTTQGDAEIWFILGGINGQLGLLEESIHCCRQAIAINPDYAEAHYNLAQAHMHQGNHEAAVASYREVVRLQPGHLQALNNLGLALYQQGLLVDALAAHQQALVLQPGNVEILLQIGSTLLDLDRREDAEWHFQSVLRLKPDNVQALFGMARLHELAGRVDDAIAACRQAVRHQPGHVEALLQLARYHLDRKELNDTAESCREILKSHPSCFEAHLLLARAYRAAQEYAHATACSRTAIRLRPDAAEAHQLLGSTLLSQGLHEEAEQAFREVLRLNPNALSARIFLMFALTYCSTDSDAILQAHKDWASHHAHTDADATVHDNNPDPERRLRIGYVSPDFYYPHPVAMFFEPILLAHDPGQVDVFCYANVHKSDADTERLRALSANWRDIHEMQNDDVTALIRRDRIDILVDLAGHTAHNRLLVFAQRPAPVQVTYLGYPNTTGLPTMDYLLTDAIVDPPGMDAYYTEKLVRLDGGFACFMPPVDAPDVTPLPATKNGYITFGSLNKLDKLTPEVVKLWSDILHSMPASRLLIFRTDMRGKATELLCSRFAEHGIGVERLILLNTLPHGESMHWPYGLIDIALDSFPWNGHTTSCLALWMGVPVITLYGQTHAGRMAASVLTHIGEEQLVAKSTQRYRQIAVKLASDIEALATLRAGLRERMRDSPVCDREGFTRILEGAYRDMWRAWCISTAAAKEIAMKGRR